MERVLKEEDHKSSEGGGGGDSGGNLGEIRALIERRLNEIDSKVAHRSYNNNDSAIM